VNDGVIQPWRGTPECGVEADGRVRLGRPGAKCHNGPSVSRVPKSYGMSHLVLGQADHLRTWIGRTY